MTADACTTADTCAAGLCVGGPPPNCDDANICTDDSCDPATGCVNANNTASCDDGDACTTADTCAAGACVGGAPPDCDDSDVCTADSCDSATGCVNATIEYTVSLSPDPLDLGNPGEQGVLTALVEELGTPVEGIVVSFAESADPNNAISLLPMAELDSNGEAQVIITGTALGTGTLSVTAVDANGDEIPGVTYTLGVPGDTCADLDAGTQTIEIMSLPCITDMTVTCEDGASNPVAGYLIASIEPPSAALTVTVIPVTDTAGEAKVLVDATGDGQGTVSASVTCGLDRAEAVVNVSECDDDSLCDDGLYCNGSETCDLISGTCQAGTAPDCADMVSCTDDTCNETTDSCDHTANDSLCTNNDVCDGIETCDVILDCQPGTALTCDDGNICTDDSCDAIAGCLNVNNTAPCDDGDACTTADTCSAGACVGGAPPNCDDANVCTDDSCDSATGCVNTNAPCDDGDACTTADTCSAGCVGGPHQIVTDDSCDPAPAVLMPITRTLR